MLDVVQVNTFILTPTLMKIKKYSDAARNLVMGTALQESRLFWIDQTIRGPGPGFGICQMERITCDDMWNRVLPRHPQLMEDVESFMVPGLDHIAQLQGNLYYAFAMCRVKYFSIKEPLPSARDERGLAEYWKQYYNTEAGKGTVEEFLENYKEWRKHA